LNGQYDNRKKNEYPADILPRRMLFPLNENMQVFHSKEKIPYLWYCYLRALLRTFAASNNKSKVSSPTTAN
jgi:hypothetical protein